MRTTLSLFFFLSGLFFNSFGQPSETNPEDPTIPKIFLNCDFCDQDFYKNEIAYLVFVRDQRLADFTVLFRVIQTGGGGEEYSLEFNGKNTYEGININEKFNSTPNMSQNNIREGLLAALKRGSLHYLIQSPLYTKIDYSVEGLNSEQTTDSIRDKWNLWIFNVNTNLYGSGQEYNRNISLGASFSANRTSDKNLFEAGFWYNNNSAMYEIEGEEPLRYSIRQFGAYNQDAITIGDHWAVGYSTDFYSSTVTNMRTSLAFSPAVEYNIFPYSESTKRQFRLNYKLGFQHLDYVSPTYRNHMNDMFLSQSFSARYRLVKNWGNIGVGVGFRHLYDEEHFFNVNFSPSISWNIFKGFNFNVQGNYSIVKDQFFLKLDEVSSEEILTGQIQLKSAYNFFVFMGISYSFGSIYNNVVNVRFQGI
jgi:hypothetical protein